MAIFQNILNFFQPNRRRIPTSPAAFVGGGRAAKSLNEAIAAVDALSLPAEVAENFKKDLEAAFRVSAEYRPGYEEGRVAPVAVNLVDLVADPVNTVWTTLDEAFTMGLPALSVAWKTPEGAIWERGFQSVWLDDGGNQVVPPSLQAATLRWTEGASSRAARLVAEKAGIKGNPGLIYMMSNRLLTHYGSLPVTPQIADKVVKLSRVAIKAKDAADKIHVELYEVDKLSRRAEDARKSGDFKRWASLQTKIEEHYRDADNIQRKYAKTGASFKERGAVIRDFEYHSSPGGALSNTPEAQYWRYWNYRNKFYTSLNVLKTYHDKGLSGLARVYVWSTVKDWVFKEGTFREHLYPPNLMKKVVEGTIGKRLKPILNKITRVKSLVTKLWSQTAKKWVKNTIVWLGEKLGLKALGAALGSAIPVAGTAVGAAIGAVVQLISESLIKEVGVPLLKILGYVFAGVIGFFGLFAIGMVVLISTILGNIAYPWEATTEEIDCDQSATATHQCVASKSAVKNIADGWGGNTKPGENHVEECYNDVIAKSQAAGVDPRVAMTIWLNESNASNYEMYKRLGEPPQDFGVPSRKGEGFTVQINSLFNLYKSFYPSAFADCYNGYSAEEGFFRAFCTAGREKYGVGQCPNLTAEGEKCVNTYKEVFSWINECP